MLPRLPLLLVLRGLALAVAAPAHAMPAGALTVSGKHADCLGGHVYAVAEGWDVHAFTRDPATGALTRIKGKVGCVGIGPGCAWLEGVVDTEDLRIPADGRHVYLAASGGVSVLRRTRGGGLRQLPGKAGCEMVRGGEVEPVIGKRACRVGRYKSRNVSGLEIAPGGRHAYALQTNTDGTYGTGVLQLMRRR